MLTTLADVTAGDVFSVCSLAVLVIAAGIALCIAIANSEEQKKKEESERLAKEAAERRREQARQQELQRHKGQLEREHREREEQAEQERQQALALTVAQLKDVAEGRFKGALAPGSLEELDRRLREAQLMFSRTGRVVTARVFAVPTGWAAIEWMLDPGQPLPLRVVGRRDGKVVFVEHAYRGVFTDLLARGREYTFKLEAFDGNLAVEVGFEFVVKIPSERQWQRKVEGTAPPSPPDSLAEQQAEIERKIRLLTGEDELWEKARRESFQKIDAEEGSEADKKRRKARLDAQIAEERDREPG